MPSRKDVSTTDRLKRKHPSTTLRSLGSPSHLIVIGASAGGRKAVKEVIKGLSDDLPAAIIIIRHMIAEPPTAWGPLPITDWLRDVTHTPIRVIAEGDLLESGVIYLTPPGMAATIDRQRFQLVPYPRTPAPSVVINSLFESAAREYGNRVIGVILTGMLRDGTAGLKAVHEAGGLTIVQDPYDAEYPDMPRNAMANLPVTFCLNLAEIGLALDLLVRRKAGLETGLAVSIRTLKERIALFVRLIHQSKANDQTLVYLSSELHALERDLQSIQTLLNQAGVH
jgi:two-component system chemotaxis response regulator CheB